MQSGLVVFVHGLGGHPSTTWGRFPTLIREDPAFRQFDLYLHKYTTSLLRWPWSRRIPNIQDLAQALSSQLENRFREHDPVTLVGHSLGGLVARRYLVDTVRNQRPLRVKNLLFYAVPNTGASLAKIAHEIPWWPHHQVAQLFRDGGFLFDLNEAWTQLGIANKVRVKYVVALQDRVVDLTSARAFPGNPDVETIDGRGHVDVVKPEHDDDLSYLIFRNFMAVPRIPQSAETVTKVTVNRFGSTGGESENAIIANGVTERLIRILSKFDRIDPVPRFAMTREAAGQTPREVAERFAADYYVEGSVERFPGSDRCTIFARLMKTDEGRLIWSDRYQRSWADAQEILVDVATKIARRVKHTVSHQELQHLKTTSIRPPAAWEAFMEGSWLVEEYNNDHEYRVFRKAEAKLKKALALDDHYTEAREQLGFLYVVAWEVLGQDRLLAKSRRVWTTLLEREPDNAFTLAQLGFITYIDGDDDGEAFDWARRAVQSNPNLTVAHNVLALLYLFLGYYESHYRITREEIFNRDPYYIYPYTNAILSLQLMGRHGQALQWAREARRIDRNAMVRFLLEGAQHFHHGHPDDAARLWQQGLTACDDPSDQSILDTALGWTRAVTGDLDAAQQRVRRYRNERWITGSYGPYFVSLCALAGATDLAVELLEHPATYARSYRYLISDKTLEPLATDLRFARLLADRYDTWCHNLQRLSADLPVPPPELATPQEFLDRVSPDPPTDRAA